MLTGKCKKDFIKYYMREGIHRTLSPVWLKRIPLSMQWGIIQDFADTIEKETECTMLPRVSNGIELFYTTYNGIMTEYKTRNSARIAAIEKFNELYNEKNK